jgi:hypothetical protein
LQYFHHFCSRLRGKNRFQMSGGKPATKNAEALFRAKMAESLAMNAMSATSAYGAVLKSLLEALRDTKALSIPALTEVFERALAAVNAGESQDDSHRALLLHMREVILQSATAVGIQLRPADRARKDKPH